jgi:Zn-finger nucleic acid-binding protein
MNCPICNIPLVMTDKQGVEIDYCPKCRGVWLDRGELEKLIDKSNSYDSGSGYGRENHDSGYGRESHSGDYKHNNHKRKSFLSEFFD